MRAFFYQFSFGVLRERMISSYSRFPLAFFYVFVFTGIFFFLHHTSVEQVYQTILLKISLSLILMFFLSLIFSLASEEQ